MPHDHDHVLADVAKGDASHVERAIAAARDAHPAWSATPWHERVAVFLRAAELLAGPVAVDAHRRDDAQPVEDGASGRDRRRVRDDRLLPLQRRVPRPDLRGAADLVARRLESARVPAARGLRLRDQPVQLHRDRGKPDDLARADGQHRRLEAGVDPGAVGVVHAAHSRGGRPAAGRDQPRVRSGRRARRCGAARAPSSPASTSPARPVSSTRSGRRSAAASSGIATTRGSSARPAARTSSSPIRPRTPRRSRRRSSAARSSTRARSALRRPGSTSLRTSGTRSATSSNGTSRRSRWATSPTSRTSWAR